MCNVYDANTTAKTIHGGRRSTRRAPFACATEYAKSLAQDTYVRSLRARRRVLPYNRPWRGDCVDGERNGRPEYLAGRFSFFRTRQMTFGRAGGTPSYVSRTPTTMAAAAAADARTCARRRGGSNKSVTDRRPRYIMVYAPPRRLC